MDQQHIPIGDLKAETWLNAFSPDDLAVCVNAKGTFYSNYCEDLLEMDTSVPETNKLSLSRDGIFHLLPEALFVEENRLRNPKLRHQPFTPEKERIQNFFVPFDTEFFHASRDFDQAVGRLETDMVDLLLKSLYDIDTRNIQNPIIRKTVPFLLQVSEIRGDFELIARLTSAVTGYNTEFQPITQSTTSPSGEKNCQTAVRIVFHIPGLTNLEYNRLYDDLGEFWAFMTEWFFPADLPCHYSIKEEKHPFIMDGSLTLDYNTYL